MLVPDAPQAFPISRLWEEMRHQWSQGTYRRIRGEIPGSCSSRPWEGSPFGRPSHLVQQHDFATGAWEGTRLSGGVRDDLASMRFEAAESLWSKACCGREATTMTGRAKPGSVLNAYEGTVLQVLPSRTGVGAVCYAEHDVTCEIWLCIDCAG